MPCPQDGHPAVALLRPMTEALGALLAGTLESMVDAEQAEESSPSGWAGNRSTSWTDWILSGLPGTRVPWYYLTGSDLLPDEDQDGGAGVGVMVEPQAQPALAVAATEASPLGLYEAGGQHGQAGYYTKTVGNAPVASPRKLSPEEVAAATAAAAAAAADGAQSAWNVSGTTWETRDTTAWTVSRLPVLLSAGVGPPGGYGSARFHIVNATVDMEQSSSSLALVRGKPRPGYDLSLSLDWEAETPDGQVVARGEATAAALDTDGCDSKEVAMQLGELEVRQPLASGLCSLTSYGLWLSDLSWPSRYSLRLR